MKVLEYNDLDLRGVEKSYQKIKAMLEHGDFYSAEVKKLQPTVYYRAKLDYTNRALFQIVSYGGKKYILMLEIIRQHAYEKSKFLQGAAVDESKIITEPKMLDAEPIIYINPSQPRFHVLDKWISFDDDQQSIYQLPLPLVMIGSAGSGKTALTLEKMKLCSGEILYVTHSPYLVQHAHQLYYANQYANDQQNIDFLSYRELIETIHIPPGKDITFREFSAWLKRLKPHKLLKDPHKIDEEFKGVITGTTADKPYLSKSDYINLGVKQSIYLAEEREIIYDVFTRYLNFCHENNYTDLNRLSYDYLLRCRPKYDAVVIDEVQDFTPIQLLLIQETLKNRGQFLMCGDANQIIHPNFFSWAKIKTLFYKSNLGESEPQLRILTSNYRNSLAVTHLANQILKIKNARLGSVDKESHFLVKSQSEKTGSVFFFQADDKNTAELNLKTRQSTHYAVIVIRDDFKEAAKKYFQTPLVFSIFETKGLEYDHIILFDFISAESTPFLALTQGVTTTDLEGDFTYGRAKEKTDKSLEIYKFYINALYVAITRSIQNVYWVESQDKHPLFNLLQLEKYQSALTLDASQSSLEEWQKEARKLEMQGKQEQANAIRDSLQQKPVPWGIMTAEQVQLLAQEITQGNGSKAQKIQLLEYALIYHQDTIIDMLAKQGLSAAQTKKKSFDLVWRKYFDPYGIINLSPVKEQVKKYGVDFRNLFNQTILMVATTVGQTTLVHWLLDSGANADLTDNAGNTAFELALQRGFTDKRFAQTKLAEIYLKLTPDSLSVQADGCLIKIDQHQAEFLLTLICVMLDKPFSTQDFVEALAHFPETICPGYRKKRQYLSSILAKNEISGKSPYNRRLFQRIRVGKYVLNPSLQIKKGDRWKAITPLQNSVQTNQKNVLKMERTYCRQLQITTQLTPEQTMLHWPPTLEWQTHPTYIPLMNGNIGISLQLVIKAYHNSQPLFTIDLVQSGIFSHATSLSESAILKHCSATLLPYATVQANHLLARSGLPPIGSLEVGSE